MRGLRVLAATLALPAACACAQQIFFIESMGEAQPFPGEIR
jgi:hypothetical protein